MNDIFSHYSDYEGQYNNGLTNHLPMVIIALYKMGASDDRAREYSKWYIENRKVDKLKRSNITIDEENWLDHLGKHRYELEYRDFFKETLDETGMEKLLEIYLNRLLDGLAAAAFHGIIRVSYGLEINNHSEIINGLAYLAITYQPIILKVGLSYSTIEARFETLSQNQHFRSKKFDGRSIFARVDEVVKDQLFYDTVTKVKVDDESLAKIRRSVINLYAKTRNFTVLHLVTSTHAMRTIVNYCTDIEKTIQNFWISLQVAYLSTNCVQLNIDEKIEVDFSWDQILKLAITKRNDHTIKFVYTCYSEYKLDNDPIYIINAYKEVKDSL